MWKKTFGRGLAKVTPQPVGKGIYSIGLMRLKRRLEAKMSQVQVWPRNSYLTKAFVPFVSDLDVTVWCERIPSSPSQVQQVLSETKRWFPALGECNLYVASEMSIWRTWINQVELGRDPILKAQINKTESMSVDAIRLDDQARAFLLRMLEQDFANLVSHAALREGKWRRHFLDVAQYLDLDPAVIGRLDWGAGGPTLIRPLLLAIFSGWNEPEAIAWSESILDYLGQRLEGKPDHEIDAKTELFTAFPHRFCFRNQLHPCHGAGISLMLAQVAWELTGNYTQIRFMAEHQSLADHLLRLEKAIEPCTSNESSFKKVALRLGQDLRTLKNLIATQAH